MKCYFRPNFAVCPVIYFHHCRYMLNKHGVEARPVITGKSVHNQRIERLWVDVFVYVTQQFKNIFHHLELQYGMNPDNDIFALHFVFLSRINHSLKEFADAWNHHPLRTEQNKCPFALWTEGFYSHSSSSIHPNMIDLTETDLSLYGVDFNGPTPELQTNNNVVVPEIYLELNERCQEFIRNMNPMANDNNFGVNTYCNLVEFLEANL